MTSRSFGDIEFFRQKKALRERFDKVFIGLKELDPHPSYQLCLARLQSVLKPTTVEDVGRLPVFSKNGTSPVEKKSDCVLYFTGMVVSHFWAFYLGSGDMLNLVQENLQSLENLAKKGLDKYHAEGNRFDGYRLVEKKL